MAGRLFCRRSLSCRDSSYKPVHHHLHRFDIFSNEGSVQLLCLHVLPPPALHVALVDDDPPEDDGVLHQGEEDQQHAGQQPDLHRGHCIRYRDSRPAQQWKRHQARNSLENGENIAQPATTDRQVYCDLINSIKFWTYFQKRILYLLQPGAKS